MKTSPNQKVLHINKTKVTRGFLQVQLDEVYQASKNLGEAEFKIYIYLCGNKDGYDMALSQVAVQEAVGVKKTAYYSAIKGLEEKGYIVNNQGNIYNFYTSPIFLGTEFAKRTIPQNELGFPQNELDSSESEQNSSQNDREIYKHIETDKEHIFSAACGSGTTEQEKGKEQEQEQAQEVKQEVKQEEKQEPTLNTLAQERETKEQKKGEAVAAAITMDMVARTADKATLKDWLKNGIASTKVKNAIADKLYA